MIKKTHHCPECGNDADGLEDDDWNYLCTQCTEMFREQRVQRKEERKKSSLDQDIKERKVARELTALEELKYSNIRG